MRIHKKIKEMPWLDTYEGGQQDFLLTISWPVIDHERLMVATFIRNRNKAAHIYRPIGSDFRLVCSKKNKTAAILYKGAKQAKRIKLGEAFGGFGTRPQFCYPEISEQDEAALGRWLGLKQGTNNHYMPELESWVSEAVAGEIQREKDARGELRDEDVNLCPEELPFGLVDAIRRDVLPNDNVLIYRKGNVRGLCYRCGEEVRATGGKRFRQHEITACPSCRRTVTAYLNTSDYFKVDYVENVATIQKGADGKTLFIRQWHLVRDSTARWDDIPGHLQEIARYAVRGNRAAKWQHEAKENYYMNTTRYRLDEWVRVSNVTVPYDGSHFFYIPTDWETDLEGTSLQYCDLMDYKQNALENKKDRCTMRLLVDWARYPAIEKFWKAGYTGIVHERLRGLWKRHQHAIIWSKPSIREALRFPVRFLKLWAPEEWTMDRMQRMVDIWALVQEGRVREGEIEELARSNISIEYTRAAFGHASAHKILAYIEKITPENQSNWHPPAAWITYRDYLQDCRRLGWDLNDHSILFPKNLNTAHQRTIQQVKYKETEINNEKFQVQREKQLWMEWEHDGLLIRLPVDGKEVIDEGQALHHCVGGYVNRMADGVTTILLIRRVEEPEKPFFTLEYLNGRVQQCRSLRNADYKNDPQVSGFVDSWVNHLAKAKKKKRAGTAA